MDKVNKDINDLIKAVSKKEKIKRDAFLYLEPDQKNKEFAQCGTCMMFTGSTCTIHGKDLKISLGASCGFYIEGKPDKSNAGKEEELVTPEESGLVKRDVRCENCVYFEKGVCNLFKLLNELRPNLFDLDEKVVALGCCNAQIPK